MQMLKTLALVALLALGLVGCVRMDVLPKGDSGVTLPLSKPRSKAPQDFDLVKSPTQIYKVGPGDTIRIEVPKDPSMTGDFPVTAEGFALLPIIGKVRVADLTTNQIEVKLNNLLSTGQIITQPEVRVAVRGYQSKVIYVVGEVANPGPQQMKADMLTLQEAIFGAGMPTPAASLKRTHVITPDYKNPVVRQVNLNDILFKGKMAENVLLRPNDIVYVPSRYSTNFSAAIRELLVPFTDINDFRFRSNIANNYNRGNGGNNNRSRSSGGGLFGF